MTVSSFATHKPTRNLSIARNNGNCNGRRVERVWGVDRLGRRTRGQVRLVPNWYLAFQRCPEGYVVFGEPK